MFCSVVRVLSSSLQQWSRVRNKDTHLLADTAEKQAIVDIAVAGGEETLMVTLALAYSKAEFATVPSQHVLTVLAQTAVAPD